MLLSSTTTNTITALATLTALLGLTSAQWHAATPPEQTQSDFAIVGFHNFTSKIEGLRVDLDSAGQGKLRFQDTMASNSLGREELPEFLDIYKAYIQCAPPNIECELRAIRDKSIRGWKFDQCQPLTRNEGLLKIIGVNCNRKGEGGDDGYSK